MGTRIPLMNKMGIPREAAAPGQVPGKNPRFLENVGWMMVTSGMILSKKKVKNINYPLVICYITMEAMAHRNRWFT